MSFLSRCFSCCYARKTEEIIQQHEAHIEEHHPSDNDITNPCKVKCINNIQQNQIPDTTSQQISLHNIQSVSNTNLSPTTNIGEAIQANSSYHNGDINNKLCNGKEKKKQKKKKIPVTNRIVSQNEILSGPLLCIEEMGNTNILKHNKLMLNPGGLIGGRKAHDGVTYFNLCHDNEDSGYNLGDTSSSMCDFGLNLSLKEDIVESIEDFVFIVFYREETKSYFIKFSDNSAINKDIFLHVYGNMFVPIKQTEVIFFGKIILELKPNYKNGSISIINLTQSDNTQNDNSTNTNTTYNFLLTNKQIITIGRNNNCDVIITGEGVSKTQCTIKYSPEQKIWILQDGTQGKQSSNGTWVVASHSYPLYNDMEIEILSNSIKINYF